MATRNLWTELLSRRCEWMEIEPTDSMERWPAADRSWLDRLADVQVAVESAVKGELPVDPRAALIDVLAVASAYVDAMDDTNRT